MNLNEYTATINRKEMEIDKQFQKLSQTRVSFENAIKKDVETIVNNLKIQFDIYERGTKEFVTTDRLKMEILSMFQFVQEIRICSGITKTGTRCSKRSVIGSAYCQAHIYKSRSAEAGRSQMDTKLLYMMTDNITPNEQIDKVEKCFIEGTFYYRDSSYIYDIETFAKVGYVENENPILTDDPFELQ
jgi:hypothetical protein